MFAQLEVIKIRRCVYFQRKVQLLESTESESTRSVAVNESPFFKRLSVTSFFLMQIIKKKKKRKNRPCKVYRQ